MPDALLEVERVSSLEDPLPPSRSDLGARRDDYVQWRQRLADKQDEVRNVGEPTPARALDPQWSPEALFDAHPASTPPADARPADVAPEVGAAPDAAAGSVGEPSTSGGRRDVDRVVEAPRPPRVDPASKRRELEGLLRRSRADAGSKQTNAATGPRTTPTELPDGQVAARRRPPVTDERDGPGRRMLDAPTGAPSSTVEPPRGTATISQHLRALNQLRVDGQISEEAFKLRKHDLFLRRSTPGRPPT